MAELKAQFEQVVKKIAPGATLVKTWGLKGGVSADTTALEIRDTDGTIKKMIVRRPGERARTHNPNVAADEYKILQLLQSAEVKVQTPYYLDESGTVFPESYLVIEYMEGEPNYTPTDIQDYVVQIATQMAKIHNLDISKLNALPKQDQRLNDKIENRPSKLDDSLQEGKIRDILEKVWPLPKYNKDTLLHGDFWPGNLLWQDNALVAVIDWEDAELGEPLSDFAITRQDMILLFGIEAMNIFTETYQSIVKLDYTNLPYWDLVAALRPAGQIKEWAKDWVDLGRKDISEQSMRNAHQLFVTQALESIPTV